MLLPRRLPQACHWKATRVLHHQWPRPWAVAISDRANQFQSKRRVANPCVEDPTRQLQFEVYFTENPCICYSSQLQLLFYRPFRAEKMGKHFQTFRLNKMLSKRAKLERPRKLFKSVIAQQPYRRNDPYDEVTNRKQPRKLHTFDKAVFTVLTEAESAAFSTYSDREQARMNGGRRWIEFLSLQYRWMDRSASLSVSFLDLNFEWMLISLFGLLISTLSGHLSLFSYVVYGTLLYAPKTMHRFV